MHRDKPLSSNPHIEKKLVKKILEKHKKKLSDVKSPMRQFFMEMESDPALASFRRHQHTKSAANRRYSAFEGDDKAERSGHLRYASNSRNVRINAKKELKK